MFERSSLWYLPTTIGDRSLTCARGVSPVGTPVMPSHRYGARKVVVVWQRGNPFSEHFLDCLREVLLLSSFKSGLSAVTDEIVTEFRLPLSTQSQQRPPVAAASWEGVRSVSAPILPTRWWGRGRDIWSKHAGIAKPAYSVRAPIITDLSVAWWALSGRAVANWDSSRTSGHRTAQNICSDLSGWKKKKRKRKQKKEEWFCAAALCCLRSSSRPHLMSPNCLLICSLRYFGGTKHERDRWWEIVLFWWIGLQTATV